MMRAQLRDLMEKQQAEVQRLTEQHRSQGDQAQQDFLEQLEELRRTSAAALPASQEASGMGSMTADSASIQRIAELEGDCLLLIRARFLIILYVLCIQGDTFTTFTSKPGPTQRCHQTISSEYTLS